MSFEVYLQCYEFGEPAGLRRDAVRALFPVVESGSEADYWLVKYDDANTCRISVNAAHVDRDSLTALCVLRPCGAPRLWEALLATMHLGHVVLYFPGCRCPLVADEAATAHLPADMIESLGVPALVRTGRDISEAIRQS